MLRIGLDTELDVTVAPLVEQSAASKKRAKKKARMEAGEYDMLKNLKAYVGYLRLARCAYVKLTDDYHGSSEGLGVWEIPAYFHDFNEGHRFVLLEHEATAEERRKAAEVTSLRTEKMCDATIAAATERGTGHEAVRGVVNRLAQDSIPKIEEWTWSCEDPMT